MTTWRTNHGDEVEVYPASDGWRYRVTATNGEIVATGSEAYTRRAGAVEAAERHHPPVGDES